MKKIVCYGDSNTFGYNPKDGSMYDENVRWTSILQKNLGPEYKVINEGMCDRTGFAENPNGFIFSGPKHFPHFIQESDIIDYLILWIGTNDLMFKYNITLFAIEKGLENLINLAQTKAKKIIIIPPVILSEKILNGCFNDRFNETSIAKSREVGEIYKKIANIHNCEIFNVNEFAKPSDYDGLHFDIDTHKIIANKLTCLF